MSKFEEADKVLPYRYVAQIVLEAETPLRVGSGESDITIDSPVLKNWNNLPMIQGTSWAGVLRASFDEADQVALFGKEFGSRVLVSHAHLLDEENKIRYKLGYRSEFLDRYLDLPVREHTAITHEGVAKDSSKFDEEVVYAGSRFKFELEFLATKDDKNDEALWETLLSKLESPLFRLGAGSTKGFGKMKVISCHKQTYEVGKDYHLKATNLNDVKGTDQKHKSSEKALTYNIAIKPDDFFSFGSGFGDDEVDDVAVKEEVVEWKDNIGNFSERKILMPASSLKGALSHRVAYHFNRQNKIFADNLEVEEFEKHIGTNNPAVATLFGAEKGHMNEGKGKALFSDLYQDDKGEVKIFDHVKIDRFTGGAVDSALYNEKVIAQKDVWCIEIVLSKEVDTDTKKAFECTLDDLCKGWLPLGGKVNRGHGVFVGVNSADGGYGENGWDCKIEGNKNVDK